VAVAFLTGNWWLWHCHILKNTTRGISLFLQPSTFLAVDATCLSIWASDTGGERIDANPQQGEDRSKKNRPDDHNGWGAVLPAHETLQEWVQVNDHPEGEEELAKERPPWLVTAVDSVGGTSNNTDQVDDQDGCWWDEKSCPLEHVELREVTIFIRGLWCDSKVGVDTSKHLEKTLEYGEKMGRDTSNNPELFIPPPLINANTTPPHLEDTSGKNWKKERDKPNTSEVANLWDDELPSEQTDGRQNTVYEKRDRSEWVNGGVDVSKSLQELQASSIAIP